MFFGLLLIANYLMAADELSLNGKWQIIFDQQNQGSAKKWQIRENFEKYYNIKSINVPSCWETLEQDYEGVAWYGKSFKLPADWKDKTVRINFGAVNYRAEVWLNGEPVGYHDGGYTPFEFEIGDMLNPDQENFLVLRVIGPIVNKDIVVDGIGRDDTPHWRGAITGGIWQTVKLLATDKIYIKNVFIEPNIHINTANVHVTLQNTGMTQQDLNAFFSIYPKKSPGEKTISKNQKLSIAPGEYKFTISLPIQDAKYWSPDSPFLYVLDLDLNQGTASADQKKIPFGMREFTLKNDDFYLNGKKLYVKTGFWEGLYPNTLAFPGNEEIIRKEFALAKEIGFNCLRPWRKQVPPITLELADELGMLIIASPAIECMGQWPTATPFMESRINIEFTEMVLRDRNHPSVILWELYNEIQRKAIGRLKHKTAVLVRSLDPSRLIVDESGGWFGGSHAYVPYSIEPVTINEIHSYKAAPVPGSTYNDFANLGKTYEELKAIGLKPVGGKNKIVPGKLLFISEVGYGGLPNLDANVLQYQKEGNPITSDYRYTVRLQKTLDQALNEIGIKNLFPTVGSFCEATQEIQAQGNKIQLEGVRINPLVDGYCVHAFTDGDWVLGAGILDIFRNKKKTFNTIKEVNQPLYLAIRTDKQNLYAGDKLGLKITSVNELAHQKGKLIFTMLDKNKKSVYSHEQQITIPEGVNVIYTDDKNINLKPGNYTIQVKFLDGKNILSENKYPLWVYQKALPELKKAVVFVNPQDNLRTFIKNQAWKNSEPDAKDLSMDQVVVVASCDTTNGQNRTKLLQVLDHVKNGSVAIYLNASNVNPGRKNDLFIVKSRFIPFELSIRNATGHWISVSHVVKPHPIFEGLPSGQIMGQEYQNVCAVKTITSLNDQSVSVVSSVTWDTGIDEMWNYMGPTQAWWGNDLAVVPYGKGKVVISTLRLIENLGKDPVADQILYNLINWASTQTNPTVNNQLNN